MTTSLIPPAVPIALINAAALGQRVYFAVDAGWNLKIGGSINVPQRGGQLRVTMIISVPGDQLTERRVQRMFAAARTGGEWYVPTDALIAYMHALIDTGETRIECGTVADAHHLVSEIYLHKHDALAMLAA